VRRGTDESRRALCSVFADAKERAMVSTDGRRMMRAAVDNLPLDKSMILPLTKVLANGILGVADGFIGGQVPKAGSPMLEIRGGPWHYGVRCVEANYPNYRQVIPNDRTTDAIARIAEADIPLLKTAVGQLTNPGNGSIAILAHAAGVTLFGGKPGADGQFPSVTLPNSQVASGRALLTLNAAFLMDAVNAGFRDVRLPQDMSPLKFHLPDNTESVYVLMPMRDIPEGLTAYAAKLFPEDAATTETQVPEPETTNKEKETEPMKSQSNPTAENETTPVNAEADADTAGAVVPPPAIIPFPASADPIQELLAELNGIQDTALDTLNRLKTLRQKARNVERHYRSRAKEIEAKSQLIAKFQKAVSL
jgi:hypothetical protein